MHYDDLPILLATPNLLSSVGLHEGPPVRTTLRAPELQTGKVRWVYYTNTLILNVQVIVVS